MVVRRGSGHSCLASQGCGVTLVRGSDNSSHENIPFDGFINSILNHIFFGNILFKYAGSRPRIR